MSSPRDATRAGPVGFGSLHSTSNAGTGSDMPLSGMSPTGVNTKPDREATRPRSRLEARIWPDLAASHRRLATTTEEPK